MKIDGLGLTVGSDKSSHCWCRSCWSRRVSTSRAGRTGLCPRNARQGSRSFLWRFRYLLTALWWHRNFIWKKKVLCCFFLVWSQMFEPCGRRPGGSSAQPQNEPADMWTPMPLWRVHHNSLPILCADTQRSRRLPRQLVQALISPHKKRPYFWGGGALGGY